MKKINDCFSRIETILNAVTNIVKLEYSDKKHISHADKNRRKKQIEALKQTKSILLDLKARKTLEDSKTAQIK